MMRWAIVVICAGLCPAGGSAGDEIFQRDLSTPFLRDEDDRFNRDRDLPGPLRKTWPYTEGLGTTLQSSGGPARLSRARGVRNAGA